MKNMLKWKLLLLLVGGAFPANSHGQEDVHFGTIFVEDVEVENSADAQNINFLTDQSGKQQQLETLYQKEVGQPNTQLKKLNVQSSRRPASTKPTTSKNPAVTKVGVVRNDELPKEIIYFVELRSFAENKSTKIHSKPSITGSPLLTLAPGEMIKIKDTAAQFIHKLRMDRDNQGFWKKTHNREQDSKNTHFYYDWRNFETITSHEFPIEVDILVPYGKNSIPVFQSPGAWTWKDCGLKENLCKDHIDLHAKAYLFDSTIVSIPGSAGQPAQHRLFYKIGYQVKDKNGHTQHRLGWVPSSNAKRKITSLPKSLLATRGPNAFGTYESDVERMQRLQKYYIFKSNMNSNNENISRWIKKNPGQSAEVFFQNIAFDFVAQANNFTLKQTGIDPFTQNGIAVGMGVFAPLFIDLEVQALAAVTVPISANENEFINKSMLFRGEQWLLYTTPLSISGTPFKFGFGAYFMSMFASNQDYGFNSLIGFQAKGLFENSSMWTGFRYGPTGQDFSFKVENRELGLDLGWRLNADRGFESWAIYGDYSDTAYVSGNTKTQFQIITLGVRKQF